MLLGASFYSTGGGMSYDDQLSQFSNFFEKRDNFNVVSSTDLNPNDLICTIYALGSAGDTSCDLRSQMTKGLDILEKITNNRISAIFPGETNIEALVFGASDLTDLDIFDADATGGRAVPEIKFDNFVVLGRKITPQVVVDRFNDIYINYDVSSPEKLEALVRNIAILSKGPVVVLDHIISVTEANSFLTCGILERNIQTGESLISRTFDYSRFLEKYECEHIDSIEVEEADLSNNEKTGFLEGFIYMRNQVGDIYKLYIRNENLILWKNDKVILTPPDFIILFDLSLRRSIHNSKIRKFMKFHILGKKSSDLWRTHQAIKQFSPKELGFDNIDSVLISSSPYTPPPTHTPTDSYNIL